MPISANARVEAVDAPGGLALVQELLNTAAGGVGGHVRTDLLGEVGTARDWASGRVDDAVVAGLDDDRVARLRGIREELRGAIHLHDAAVAQGGGPAEPVGLVLQPSGEVTVEAGASGIAGLVLAEVLLAQQRGEWPRLKICALPVCGTVFYDRSRNTSALYHAAWCSNFVNLRASRARQRQA